MVAGLYHREWRESSASAPRRPQSHGPVGSSCCARRGDDSGVRGEDRAEEEGERGEREGEEDDGAGLEAEIAAPGGRHGAAAPHRDLPYFVGPGDQEQGNEPREA